VKAKFEATGRVADILTPAVINQFLAGNVAGAANAIGARVPVSASITPYSTQGFDMRAGLSLMGVGLTGRATALRETMGQPLWQYQGTASSAATDLSNFVQRQQANARRLAAQVGGN
jgi:hypothetical protein